jgi:hypothetical protein
MAEIAILEIRFLSWIFRGSSACIFFRYRTSKAYFDLLSCSLLFNFATRATAEVLSQEF